MSLPFSSQDERSIQAMFAKIAGRYDLANLCLSCGLDHFWRKFVARQVAVWRPARLLDVATGSGAVALTIQRKLPAVKIFGVDFCAPMLVIAQERGLSRLVVGDALRLPFPEKSFDVVTIAFGLRNMASYDRALREMARVLVPGGHFLLLDFSLPGPPLRSFYRWYLHRVLPLFAGALTGQPDAYRYLGASIETFPRGEVMLEFLRSCGFVQPAHRTLSAGVVSVYTASVGL